MKKIYHLLVTSYKLRVKLPRFCFAKSPLQNLKGIYCSGVARNAPTHIITSPHHLIISLFLLLPFVATAQCPFDNPDPNTNTTEIKAYYGYQYIGTNYDDPLHYADMPANVHTAPNPPSQLDPPVPRYVAPFLYEGVVPNRHKYIPKSERDNDKIIPDLLTVPLDAEWSIKLGNDQIYYECEAIVYEFTPDIMNPILLLDFAVVFEDPEHDLPYQPRFIVRVTDDSGNLLEQCTEYDVSAGAGLPNFQTYQPQGTYQGEERWHNTTVRWRDWTKMSVDLSKFVGQPIQVQFINYDCNQGVHFGYCYFTAQCIPNTFKLDICEEETFSLVAPPYFDRYLWSDGQTTDTAYFTIDEDIINSNITCKVISDMGCACTLYAYITDDSGNPQYETPYTGTICEGETYTLNHFNLPPQDAGIHEYQLVIVDIELCDVFVSNLTLTVIPRNTYFRDSICAGSLFDNSYWKNIPEYPTPGVWRDSVNTGPGPTPGCDLYDMLELIVSVSMDVLDIQTSNPSPCTGEYVTYSFVGAQFLTSYSWDIPGNAVVVGGSKYTPQVTLYFTDASDTVIKLNGANGCGNGVATLNISPNQSYDIQKKGQVCQGEVYNGFDFNLGVQNEVGLFVHSKHLQSVHGCDSTVTLGLNVVPVHKVHIEPIDTVLCNKNEEVLLWALVDEDDYPDSGDCSTDYYHSLFIYNCGYSYLWSTSDTTGGISVTPDVTTTYTVTVTSNMGCEVTASQIVVVAPEPSVAIYDTICFGETYSAYDINASTSGSYTKYNYSMGDCIRDITVHLTVLDEAKLTITETVCSGERYIDQVNGFDFTLYGEGSYIDTMHFISQKGCDSLVIFNFTINPQKETIINDNICQYEIYNNIENGFNVGKQNFSGLQVYTKNLKTSNNCDSTVILRLYVYPSPVNIVDFDVVPGYAGVTPTIFTNWSIYYDESVIAGWEWYLDNVLFATTKDASTIIPSAGAHTIKLRVTSINGCWDETSQTINVPSCPVPTISVTGSSTQTACGLETVTFEGTFSGANLLKVQTLGSHGRKARLTFDTDNNTGSFTITYTPTIANVNNTIQIILTATDTSLPCPGKTQAFTVDVKPKPRVRFKGVCAE